MKNKYTIETKWENRKGEEKEKSHLFAYSRLAYTK
jgi:hypothetical protein